MRATRFIPVVYATTEEILAACNRRIVVAEDVGGKAPWDTDLTGDVLLVVGAENSGVSKEVLEAADEIVRLPMPASFRHTTYKSQSVLWRSKDYDNRNKLLNFLACITATKPTLIATSVPNTLNRRNQLESSSLLSST